MGLRTDSGAELCAVTLVMAVVAAVKGSHYVTATVVCGVYLTVTATEVYLHESQGRYLKVSIIAMVRRFFFFITFPLIFKTSLTN